MIGSAFHHSGAFVRKPANILTVARICLAPLLFSYVLEADAERGASWEAFTLGVFMAVTDNVDGRLARKWGTSRSGAFLDPLADKIVVLGSMFCLVAVDSYWWLPVAFVTVREVVITAWRSYWATQGRSIPARRSAKYKTLVQGAALLIAVAPPLETHRLTVATALWIAVVFTVVTGYQYLHDARTAMTKPGSRT